MILSKKKYLHPQTRKAGGGERNEERRGKSKKTDLAENEEGETGSSPDLESKAREEC